MPPRKQTAIAVDPWPRDIRRAFHVTERELAELAALPLEVALGRIRRQAENVERWTRRRARFLEGEVRRAERERVLGLREAAVLPG